MIRKARADDIDAVERIYNNIHTAEENGKMRIGWIRGVYPTRATALLALERDDLFVCEEESGIKAAAIINKTQVDVYADAAWLYTAPDEQVCVLHTLVVEPEHSGRGTGKRFVSFCEDYAKKIGCTVLRMDTNAKNAAARALYARLGYREADIVPCVFNGIEGVQLVLLEKKI